MEAVDVLVGMVAYLQKGFINTAEPLLRGHPWGNGKWPLNSVLSEITAQL